MAKYSSKWKSALNKLEIDEKEHSEFMVAHAHAFEAILLIINKRLTEAQKEVFKKAHYDNPNWSLRQADINGAYRELVELKNLLED